MQLEKQERRLKPCERAVCQREKLTVIPQDVYLKHGRSFLEQFGRDLAEIRGTLRNGRQGKQNAPRKKDAMADVAGEDTEGILNRLAGNLGVAIADLRERLFGGGQ